MTTYENIEAALARLRALGQTGTVEEVEIADNALGDLIGQIRSPVARAAVTSRVKGVRRAVMSDTLDRQFGPDQIYSGDGSDAIPMLLSDGRCSYSIVHGTSKHPEMMQD